MGKCRHGLVALEMTQIPPAEKRQVVAQAYETQAKYYEDIMKREQDQDVKREWKMTVKAEYGMAKLLRS